MPQPSKKPLRWAAPGDVNAFFGLMLDNIADLLLTVSLLVVVFGFPETFALRYMVPGTAIGVLVGDLLFFWMAISLAKKTGRDNITAMPLGLDTPSTFGMVFFVLGPAFLQAGGPNGDAMAAAAHAWKVGICAIVISGLFKIGCSFGSNWVRKVIPRAGLLGSLASIALVLISFLPLMEILHYPIVGLVSLAVILTVLVARVPLPGKVPGALGGLLIGGFIYYFMKWQNLLPAHDIGVSIDPSAALLPYEWLTVFQFGWVSALQDTVQFLPVIIPFALATVVGGIDCTESAAAAGDEFDTNTVVRVEGFATLVAGLCGGVIQTTPYIGHPAYKAMGGRSAYTLATALFIGGAGVIGYFGYLYAIIPRPTVFPILVFIGLEITSQSFSATPRRHYPAVALACVPALAALAYIFVGKFTGELLGHNLTEGDLSEALQLDIGTLRILANGFIVTSLLWASWLAALIDRRLKLAAIFAVVMAGCALFGIMHSPEVNGGMFFPWQLEDAIRNIPYRYAIGYMIVAVLLLAWDLVLPKETLESKEENATKTESET